MYLSTLSGGGNRYNYVTVSFCDAGKEERRRTTKKVGTQVPAFSAYRDAFRRTGRGDQILVGVQGMYFFVLRRHAHTY